MPRRNKRTTLLSHGRLTLDAAPFAKGKEGIRIFGGTRLADGERVAVKVFTLPALPHYYCAAASGGKIAC